MAINKVIYGQNTIIDITDTTAVATDVASGKYFYLANGQKVSGTASGGASSGDVWQDEYGLVHLSDEPGTNVLVTPLSITSNGTYTAPSGTAYSPVTVTVPQPQPTARTASISTSGNSSYCYVKYNNTKYYTIGDSFTFYEGDTIIFYVMGEASASINICGDVVYSTSSYGSKSYSYTAPADDLTISLSYNASPSSGYASITVSLTDYPLSILTGVMPSTYNKTVGPSSGYYGLKYVQISGDTNLVSGNIKSGVSIFGVNGTYGGGGGVEIDDIAMRTISGVISGNASIIKEYAFAYCSRLTQVIFSSCISINSNAFSHCYQLSQVSFPACTLISNHVFAYCSQLTQVSFPACTSISANAFAYCSQLTQASFSVCATIGASAFAYCSQLTQVSFPACTLISANAFNNCVRLSQVDFPECSIVSDNAFYFCSQLSQISFPSCVRVGGQAFFYCSVLSQASFPACTNIGASAFYTCYQLSQISFPSCSIIYSYAFYGCRQLSQASFPACTNIGASAFAYCSQLTQASFSVCATIGSSAFYACYQLSQVSFPEVTTIYNHAFLSCSSLTSVSFIKCKSIYSYAFANCLELSTVILSNPSTAGQIYSAVFNKCYRLLSLYILTSSIYSLVGECGTTFSSTPIWNYTDYTSGQLGSIFVPSSMYSSYLANTKWVNASARLVSLTDTEINNVLTYGRHDP